MDIVRIHEEADSDARLLGVTLDWSPADSNPNMDDPSGTMRHYHCTLRRRSKWCDGGEAVMRFFFSVGSAIPEPRLSDVLECLATDALDVEGVTFEEWCQEYGLDEDSRRAKRSFDVTLSQSVKFRRMFSDEEIEQLANPA